MLRDRLHRILSECQYIDPPLTTSEVDDLEAQILSLIAEVVPEVTEELKDENGIDFIEGYEECRAKMMEALR